MHYVQPERLASDVCRAVYAWYVGLCPGAAWPPDEAARRVEDLPGRALSNLGIVDVEPEPLRVFYRIMGSAISQSFAVQGSGRYLDELGLAQEADILALYRDSLAAEGPLFGRGQVETDGASYPFEAGTLPFGTPESVPRRFLIVEDYFDMPPWRPALRRRLYTRG